MMRKELALGVSAFALSIGAVANGLTHKSQCEDMVRYRNYPEKDIVVCEVENRVLAQGKNTQEWLLPEYVTSTWQVMKNFQKDNSVMFNLHDGDLQRVLSFDLETGEVEQVYAYSYTTEMYI